MLIANIVDPERYADAAVSHVEISGYQNPDTGLIYATVKIHRSPEGYPVHTETFTGAFERHKFTATYGFEILKK